MIWVRELGRVATRSFVSAAEIVAAGDIVPVPPRRARLRSDEVARQDVRLVTIARDGKAADRDAIGLHRFAELPALLRAGDLVVVNEIGRAHV